MFGRRSEKQLPRYDEARLSLFDARQGEPVLAEEPPGMTSPVEDIKKQAEKRRQAAKAKSKYKIPEGIERRETIVEPQESDNGDNGEDRAGRNRAADA